MSQNNNSMDSNIKKITFTELLRLIAFIPICFAANLVYLVFLSFITDMFMIVNTTFGLFWIILINIFSVSFGFALLTVITLLYLSLQYILPKRYRFFAAIVNLIFLFCIGLVYIQIIWTVKKSFANFWTIMFIIFMSIYVILLFIGQIGHAINIFNGNED